MNIQLDEQEWRQVLTILSQAPWGAVNTLILKIGDQMRLQAAQPAAQPQRWPEKGNGADVDDPLTPSRSQQHL